MTRWAYWRWKLWPPYISWYGSAWYWECGWGRLGYWWPVHQAGPRAGEICGIGFYLRIGRWSKGVLVLPC